MGGLLTIIIVGHKDAYTSAYQTPYHFTTYYEPYGSKIRVGSNLVDYVTFCSDCHNESNINL